MKNKNKEIRSRRFQERFKDVSGLEPLIAFQECFMDFPMALQEVLEPFKGNIGWVISFSGISNRLCSFQRRLNGIMEVLGARVSESFNAFSAGVSRAF